MAVLSRMLAVGVAAFAGAAGFQPGPDAVYPRGVSEISLGEPVGVGPEGVVLARERGPDGKPTRTVTVGWDRVRAVTGRLAPEAEKYAEVADKAWRARTRLEHGDWVAAEPLLEELFTSYRTQSGPTAVAIAGGLMRCRVSRGAQTGAVEPWLAWLRASPSGGDQADAEVGKMIDTGTGLVASLPPMWASTAAVQAFAQTEVAPLDPATKPSSAEIRAHALLSLYVVAAKAECGITTALPSQIGATADPGVRLVYDIVKSRVGDEVQRRDARRGLQERLNSKSALWIEVWCRVALGRSLASETDPEARRLGIASLAYAASRTNPTDAYLTGLAMTDIAVALSRSGNDLAAGRLAAEAADRFPDHPALESPTLAKWMIGRGTQTNKPAAAPADGQKGDQKP